jgi:hypothetical protein
MWLQEQADQRSHPCAHGIDDGAARSTSARCVGWTAASSQACASRLRALWRSKAIDHRTHHAVCMTKLRWPSDGHVAAMLTACVALARCPLVVTAGRRLLLNSSSPCRRSRWLRLRSSRSVVRLYRTTTPPSIRTDRNSDRSTSARRHAEGTRTTREHMRESSHGGHLAHMRRFMLLRLVTV